MKQRISRHAQQIRKAFAKKLKENPSKKLTLRDVNAILASVSSLTAQLADDELRVLQEIFSEKENFAFDASGKISKARRRLKRKMLEGRLREANDGGYAAVAKTILEFSKQITRKGLRVGGHTYHSNEFNTIAKLVESQDIKVLFFSGIDGDRFVNGSYLPRQKEIRLKVNREKAVLRKSTVIHEVVHCLQDFKDVFKSVHHVEAEAHIVQAYYLFRSAEGHHVLEHPRLKHCFDAAVHLYDTGAASPEFFKKAVEKIAESPGYRHKTNSTSAFRAPSVYEFWLEVCYRNL